MKNNKTEIVALPKEKWKDVRIPLVTRSSSYYDIKMTPMDEAGVLFP